MTPHRSYHYLNRTWKNSFQSGCHLVIQMSCSPANRLRYRCSHPREVRTSCPLSPRGSFHTPRNTRSHSWVSAPEYKEIATSFIQLTFIAKDTFHCSKFVISIALSLR